MSYENYGSVKVQNVRYDGSFEVISKDGDSHTVNVDDFLHIDPNAKKRVMSITDSWIASVYNTAENKGEKYPFKCEVNTRKDSLIELEAKDRYVGDSENSHLKDEILQNFGHTRSVRDKKPS